MTSEVWSALFFGALAGLTLSFARKKGFFSLENQKESWRIPLSWYHVLAAFGIYFATAIFLVPLFAAFFRHYLFTGNREVDFLGFSSWLNFITSLTILSLLAFYFTRLPFFASILRKKERGAIGEDVRMAFLSWIVSFPLVLFMSHFLDLFVYLVFQAKEVPEQLAVHFLKMTFQHPTYFFLAVVTIVAFAPMIEELLFRGFLQSFLRKYLGSKQAIVSTSICFSFFHYSPEQGLGNIPIIGSLFALALFLGFVYEKRGSLAAPIALHATFNAISVVNLYFLGEFL